MGSRMLTALQNCGSLQQREEYVARLLDHSNDPNVRLLVRRALQTLTAQTVATLLREALLSAALQCEVATRRDVCGPRTICGTWLQLLKSSPLVSKVEQQGIFCPKKLRRMRCLY